MRWRPTLGLLVILSAVILVEGVVTVGRLVLASGSPTVGLCNPNLEMRANKWCELEFTSRVTGELPTTAEFTSALGAQSYAWTLRDGRTSRIIDSPRFTIFAACIGNGRLRLKVYAGDTARYDLVFGCLNAPQAGFLVRTETGTDGTVYTGPYVITAEPIGTVTTAEYFIQAGPDTSQ